MLILNDIYPNRHSNFYMPIVVIWENGTETCIISYMKRIASPGSMQDAGCLGLVHWDDPERWYGKGGGRRGSGLGTHLHLWWIHVDVWQNQYNIAR